MNKPDAIIEVPHSQPGALTPVLSLRSEDCGGGTRLYKIVRGEPLVCAHCGRSYPMDDETFAALAEAADGSHL